MKFEETERVAVVIRKEPQGRLPNPTYDTS
jgi:hypothetical protein